jgi:hypothetical protein
VGRGGTVLRTAPDKDAIWQSEVRLKEVAGDMAKSMLSDMSLKALSKCFKIFVLVSCVLENVFVESKHFTHIQGLHNTFKNRVYGYD